MNTTTSPAPVGHSATPLRSRSWVRFVGPVVVLAIAGLAVGRFLWAGPSPSSGGGSRPSGPVTLQSLQAQTVAAPSSPDAWLSYGTLAIRTAIATGDPSFYGVATSALDRALALAPDSADALASRAGLALSLHSFADALPLAERAVNANPFSIGALAALFDARIENGDYPGAEATLDQLLSVNPGVAAYSRVSYFRQLTGDMSGARTAMQQAVAATGPGMERATVATYLGDINLEIGDLDAASAAYSIALDDQPDSIAASLGQARVLVARGSLAEAGTLVDRIVTRSPQPAAATLQGEIALLRNDAAAADRAFALVRANEQILQSQGVVTDLESALFAADRGDGSRAVEIATAAYANRRTVFTADALAWARFTADGSVSLPLVEDALAGGITSPQIRVHAAAIFAVAGHSTRAAAELRVAFDSVPWLTPSIRPVAARLAGELNVPLPQGWSL